MGRETPGSVVKWGTGIVWLVGSLPLAALQVRSHDPARHDRFTGFPANPAFQPGFLHDPSRFTGLGWDRDDPRRHFALVSPLHFVCATHYAPAPGTVVRFLNATGNVIERSVQSVQGVPDPLGNVGDLSLGVLSSAIEAGDGVTAFPYLNLAAESHATGIRLAVFGKADRGGRGSLGGFASFAVQPDSPTRLHFFDFLANGNHADDCWFEVGDSGSASFAWVNGIPALVGIHTAVDPGPPVTTNWDTHVPHYLTSLNGLMAPLGHQMTPVLADLAAVTPRWQFFPSRPRRLEPATMEVNLVNPGTRGTQQLVVEFDFQAPWGPDSLNAPEGWTTEAAGPTYWSFRTSTFAAGAFTRFLAHWASMPSAAVFQGEMRSRSTAAPDSLLLFTTELLPSYAEWSAGLTPSAPAADPDQDTIPNLEEYAFGGDPAIPSQFMAGGPPLRPRLFVDGTENVLAFPVRNDADNRRLRYVVEFSANLTANTWTTGLPAGAYWDQTPLSPPVAGFESQELRWPVGTGPRFCRVRVELLPSYAGWIAGYPDPAPGADPDHDGVPNLVEYAHGGDPSTTSRTMAAGPPLLPQLEVAGTNRVLSFPVRTDAEDRNMEYVPEFSTDLTSGSWTEAAPPDVSVTDEPFVPPVPGFARRVVSWPAGVAAGFCRVRIQLNE